MVCRTFLFPAAKALSAAALALCSGQVLAAPGDTDSSAGAAEATIVEPIDIQRVADLRFGRIMQPTTAGTLRVNPDATIATTGGVTGNETTPQAVNGRGPAVFALFGEANRRFTSSINGTVTITVTNGTATMSVKQFRDNTGPGFSQLDSSGYFALFVGARLDVEANQQAGAYAGTFDVTVRYN